MYPSINIQAQLWIFASQHMRRILPCSNTDNKVQTHMHIECFMYNFVRCINIVYTAYRLFYTVSAIQYSWFVFHFKICLLLWPEACVSLRYFCWFFVLVHIMCSHRDRVLVQREGSHNLIMELILGTKRCLESLGPRPKCWSTLSRLCSQRWNRGFWYWGSSKKQFKTYTVELQKCIIGNSHQTWMIPHEITT